MIINNICKIYQKKPHVSIPVSRRAYIHRFPTDATINSLGKCIFGALAIILLGGLVWKSNKKCSDLSSTKLTLNDDGPYSKYYNEIKAKKEKWDNSIIPRNAAKEMISRASEIKELCKDEYVTLIHGQSIDYEILNIITDKYAKEKLDSIPHLFKFMRMPVSENEEELLVKHGFIEAQQGMDNGYAARNSYASFDGYLLNTDYEESADHFLRMRHGSSIGNLVADHLVKYGKFDKFTAKKIGQSLNNLGDTLQKTAPCGNLWIVCIPKKLIENSKSTLLYRSHPYGKVCQCHPSDHDAQILDLLQNNILNESSWCDLSTRNVSFISQFDFFPPNPQYRVNLHELTPENEVMMLRTNPYNKEERKKLKAEVLDRIDSSFPKRILHSADNLFDSTEASIAKFEEVLNV